MIEMKIIIYILFLLLSCARWEAQSFAPLPQLLLLNDNSQIKKTMFITSSTVQGNVGITNADTICNNDSNNIISGIFHALLVDNANRVASTTANAGDNQINWAFKPNTTYYRLDKITPVLTTNNNNLFIFGTFYNEVTTSPITIWTGLNNDWTTSNRHCTNWSTNLPPGNPNDNKGIVGIANAIDDTFIRESNAETCDNFFSLICIEQ